LRLRLPDAVAYAEIDAALDAAARARIKDDEAHEWMHR
jgi:hypothetical protein